jgi:ribose-phosphate pyrophosphokinase
MPQIGTYLKELGLDKIIAPDKGAQDLAKTVAEGTGCDWDYIPKKRIDDDHVEMDVKDLDVSDKKVAIVDDIIATGGTIAKAAEQLKSQGAKEVYAACTHGLFAKDGLSKLRKFCENIISTDTIENETSVVSAAKGLAEAVK